LHGELEKPEKERDFSLEEGELFFTTLDDLGAPPGSSNKRTISKGAAAGGSGANAINFLSKIQKSGTLQCKIQAASQKKVSKKRYWVVLTSHFVSFFVSPQDTRPIDSLPVEDATVSKGSLLDGNESSSSNNSRSEGECAISIQHGAKTYVIICSTSEESTDWFTMFIAQKKRSAQVKPKSAKLSALELRIQNHLAGKKQSYDCISEGIQPDAAGEDVQFLFRVEAFSSAFIIERSWKDCLALHEELINQFPKIIFPTTPPDLVSGSGGKRSSGWHSDSTVASSSSSGSSLKKVKQLKNFKGSKQSKNKDSTRSVSDVSSSAANERTRTATSSSHKRKSSTSSHKRNASGSGTTLAPRKKSLRKTLSSSGSSSVGLNGELAPPSEHHRRGSVILSGANKQSELDRMIGLGDGGLPTRGAIFANKFLRSYIRALLGNFHTSQSDLMFSWLELDSPYRAVGEECQEHLQYLQKTGTNMNMKNREGRTPMHAAAIISSKAMIDALVKYDANINEGDKGGNTPLHIALRRDNAEIAHYLIEEKGADVTIPNGANTTPLHLAAEKGMLSLASTMIELAPDQVTVCDKKGRSALSLAVVGGHDTLATYLLEKGASPEYKDRRGNTLLHIAVLRALNNCVKKLLALTNINVNAQNKHGVTPLHLAVKQANQKLVGMLQEASAIDYSLSDSQGLTPGTLAAKEGHVKITDMLAPHSDFNFRSKQGHTALHFAASSGKHEIVEILSKNGAEIDAVDSQHNETPLHLAVRHQHPLCVEVLLKLGADTSIKNARNRSPLHTAAMMGNPKIVKDVIELGKPNVNVVDDEGCSPLHFSIWAKNADACRVLVESKQADLELADSVDLELPIHAAGRAGCPDIVKCLLEADLEVEVKRKDGNNPIHLAAIGGNPETMKLLLDYKKTTPMILNAMNLKGNTPLHLAAQNANEACALLLAKAGASLTLTNKSGSTPFQTASKQLRQKFEANTNAASSSGN